MNETADAGRSDGAASFMPSPDAEHRRGFRDGTRWARAHRDRGPEFLFAEERAARTRRTFAEHLARGPDGWGPAEYARGYQHGIVEAIRHYFGPETYTRLFEAGQRSKPYANDGAF